MKFYFEKYIINVFYEMFFSFVIMVFCYCVEFDSDIFSWIILKKKREKKLVVDLLGELYVVL